MGESIGQGENPRRLSVHVAGCGCPCEVAHSPGAVAGRLQLPSWYISQWQVNSEVLQYISYSILQHA